MTPEQSGDRTRTMGSNEHQKNEGATVNFNSFLLTLVVGVSGFVGMQTYSLGNRVAVIEARMSDYAKNQEKLMDAMQALDRKLTQLTPREEVIPRISACEDKIRALETRVYLHETGNPPPPKSP